MGYRRLLLILYLGISLGVSGQYTKEFRRIFLDADYLFQAGFYDEAYSRYRNLLTLDPGNCNILFHCGACCLNISGKEAQAVTYLEEASPGVTPDFRYLSVKEQGAPVITWYMLGKAHHLNNEFGKAEISYNEYLKQGQDEDPVQLEYTRLQIDACKRAKTAVQQAPSFKFRSILDHFDEELPSCSRPVVSGDGNILIFLVDYPDDKKIMMTRREGDEWTRPRVINSEIGMVGETYPTSLSFDGKELYLVHHYYSHSDIFVSRYEGQRWTEAEPLGSNVNGRTSETHASISRDGKSLYFVSDARGGQGSLDIYVSRLNERGDWGPPVNLGPVINTPYEEQTPFISANDSVLFFSSQGHASIGGLDVFCSELGKDGKWKEPVNLGQPVNTTGEDLFFNPGWDELEGYYAVRREDDPTTSTINMVMELEPQEELVLEDHAKVPVPGIQQAIEPEETEEIHEALNKSARESSPPAVTASTRFTASVPFAHNTYELELAAVLEVEKIADLMLAYPGTRVLLTGHADETGSPDYNLILSWQRAEQVAGDLVSRGIDPGRITVEGKGAYAPVALSRYPDGSEAPLGLYLNRQVIVTLDSPEPIHAQWSGVYIPASLKAGPENQKGDASYHGFTIQLAACQNPAPRDHFRGLEGVREYTCGDGFIRYAMCEYRTYTEAKTALMELRDTRFPDAFIQTLDWFRRAQR
jgi:outer membrane protein OmpA-like peptidoglycan-associated protein